MAKQKVEGEVRSETQAEGRGQNGESMGINRHFDATSTGTPTETRPVSNGTQVSNGQRPERVFKMKGIRVSVFRNRTADGQREFLKASSPQKVYKDGNEFKTTYSLGGNDIPIARHLLKQAWEYINEFETNRGYEE